MVLLSVHQSKDNVLSVLTGKFFSEPMMMMMMMMMMMKLPILPCAEKLPHQKHEITPTKTVRS